MRRYEVIKDIPSGWETSAKVGDILRLRHWEGIPTLFKNNKAVCDADSRYAIEYCKPVEEGEALNATNQDENK
ncbi:hypothetical protein [Cohnella nanjingensis]|uniref:Uncharacterized protein n=1 Tax=Cohnella nanjingensis TaxID=1387779 RepID=A0A7X0VHG4_9BACL|nr:hypothetical protein [Cohnella nanjingensis]MBB6672609.1 hypothetical protein [Cohnella nanjingensis]